MKLYLIRHGRQCDKRCNVDVSLSEEGIHQAKLAGMRMKDWGIEMVYSSDMLRAKETAYYANQYWNVPHEIIPEFRELCFGDMEGLYGEEIEGRFREFKAKQDEMKEDIPYPGGESATELVRRAMPKLIEVAGRHKGSIAIATHGVWIRAVLCHILGMDMAKWRTMGVTFENGSITELHYRKEKGQFTLERFNDYAHLEPYQELLRSAWGVKEN
ncbi:histidine phosphatase family protein [Lacrimispora sphenoides]|uniref:Probable phosphoglycerate mutase n=1 Tax=Lacrimispora sphenoides JCM 1415 TaxID=1297793 RepID=A0ABY1C683_9FIRM|nr:histidine phosphatase family protein [Lacrimispora sphenoides]SET73308.1 probable phosphoglycerate mutase [[Clostridium] sphenoides JCM 1415]SUY50843.1 phosphoglycerate mutase [Lacrimispora sphenoides]